MKRLYGNDSTRVSLNKTQWSLLKFRKVLSFSTLVFIPLLIFISSGKLFSQVLNLGHVAKIENGFGAKLPFLKNPTSVAVSGNFAYVVSQTSNTLEIFDVTLPRLPEEVGSIEDGKGGALLNFPQAVVISGNYAYVTSNNVNGALEIIDVSNPTAPVHAGSVTGNALNTGYGLFVQGNYAYVVSVGSKSLQIVNITDKSAPIIVGSLADGGGNPPYLEYPNSVFVSGNYAYVASIGSGALEIIDVSDPTNPVDAGSYFGVTPYSVAVSGNYAYVAGGGGLDVVDISDPTNPSQVGSLADGGGVAPFLRNINWIVISGNFAYMADASYNVFEIIDITTKTAPKAVIGGHGGILADGGGVAPFINTPNSVSIAGNYAYVANLGNNTLEIIDITNPQTPTHATSMVNGGGGTLIGLSRSVFISGNYAYITSEDLNSLEIIDISVPSAPVHKGNIVDGGGVAPFLNTPKYVYVSGHYAYVASYGSNALEVIDVTNPAAPTHAGSLANGAGLAPGALLTSPNSVVVVGSYAYVGGPSGLEIVNITTPTNPTHSGRYSSAYVGGTRPTVAVNAAGTYAYFVGGSYLQVIDITSKTVPKAVVGGAGGILADGVGVAPYLQNTRSIYVSGNYAYITSLGRSALEIVDISNQASPAHKGSIVDGAGGALLNGPEVVKLSGNYAFVTTASSNAVEVIDVSNPATPVHVNSLTNGTDGALLNQPDGLDISGNYVYVTGLGGGLEIAYLYSPRVKNFSPASGAVGSTVTITGENFKESMSINFNGTPVVAHGAITATSAVITVPVGATVGSISVTVDGQIAKSPGNFIVTPIAEAASSIGQNNFTANWSDVGGQSYYLEVSKDNFATTITKDALLNGANAVFLLGNYAYVASQNSNALEIVDVTNPALPVHKGSLVDGGGTAPFLKTADGIYVSGNYAYVLSATGNALEIVDVTNPALPVHKGSLLDGGGNAPFLNGASGVFVSGNYAYVASAGSGALEIIDVSNPALPVHAASLVDGELDGQGGHSYLGGASGVYVSGNYAYVVASGSNALEIVDISNPTSPFEVGILFDGNGSAPFLASPFNVFVSGNYAYVSSYGSNALEIVDITDPFNPVHAGSLVDGGGSAPFLSNATCIFVAGNYAYLTSYGSNALEIVDVSNPLLPTHKGRLLDGGSSAPYLKGAWTLYVSGNYAYVAGINSNSLEIVDVSNAAKPVHKGSLINGSNYNTPGNVTTYAVSGLSPGTSYQYLVHSSGGGFTVSTSSNIINVLTIPAVPLVNHATSVTQTGFKVNWNSVSGASGYYLDVASDKNFVTFLNGINNISVSSTSQSVGGAGSGVTYYYRVRSTDASGTSPSSVLDSVQTIPATPTANLASLITTSGFTANWSSVSGTKNYYLDVSTDNFNTFVAGYQNQSAGTNTSQALIGLSPGITYQYRVRTANASGNSSNSNIISIVTIPSAPVASAATSITQNSFGVGWSAVTGATSYSIDVATDNGFLALVYNNINIGNVNSYSPASLNSNTNYYLRLRANDASGSSTNSNAISVTTLSTLPASQSTGITFNGVGSTSLTLNFTPGNGAFHLVVANANAALSAVPSNAKGYTPNTIFGQGSTLGSGFVVANGVGPITVTGLSPSTTYYFQVYDFAGSGGSENYLTANSSTNPLNQNTLATAAIGQPTNLVLSSVSGSSVTVSYTVATGNPAGYLVLRSTSSQPSIAPINGTTYSIGSSLGNSTVAYVGSSLSFFDGGLPTSTKYFYSVYAFNGSGVSTIYLTTNPLQGNVILDVIPPVISTSPTPNPATITGGNTPIFNAIITDNVSVDSAKIFYRGISKGSFKSARMSPSVGGNYSVQIQTNWYDSLGLEYYFWASDENGNTTDKPSSTNFAQLVNVSISLPSLPSGSGQADYRIVSFPYQLSTDNKVATVYPGVPWNDNTKAALWRWDPTLKNGTGGYDQYGSGTSLQTIDQGKGYWVLTAATSAPQLNNVVAPKYNHSNLFSMTLKPKWNEIGNPYPVPISWDDVIALNQQLNPGALFSPLSIYDGSGYKVVTGSTVLKAFQGGFVKNLGSSDITIQIPFVGQTTAGGRIATIGSDISQDSWNIFLHINQNGLTNQLGGFGMNPLAESGPDRFDNFNPPRFLDIPEVNFVNSEYPGATFSNNMIKSREDYTWQFTPSGNWGTPAELTWNTDIITNSRQLFLLDEEQINVIDMSSVNRYDFTMTSASRFRIFYGSNIQNKVTTLKVVASTPYPNPLTPDAIANINLALPDNNSEYNINLQLYNGQGDLMETVNRKLTSGVHQLEFALAGQSLASGIYIYKLSVIAEQSSSVYTGKILKP